MTFLFFLNQLKPVIKWDFLYSKEQKFYMVNTERTSLPGIFRIGDKWKFLITKAFFLVTALSEPWRYRRYRWTRFGIMTKFSS